MKKGIQKQSLQEYIAVFQEEKAGGFSVWVPDLPGCASQGETFEDALINIKEAMQLYLEDSAELEPRESYKRQFVMPVTISHA